MVTLKDIAKEANVSIATVSRYLNHKITIRPETEESILTAIKRLNYVPNVVAQSLKNNRTLNVAVILPKVNTLYYSEMTSGISSVLSRHGFNLFIFEVDHLGKSEEAILQTLRENMIAGAIFLGLSFDKRFYQSLNILRDSDIPVVFTNRQIEYTGIPLVYPNFTVCGKLAAQHLIDTGRKKLALVHSLKDSGLLAMHIRSFSGPMKKAGLDEPALIYSDQGLHPSEACISEIRASRSDGIFVLNELNAAGITHALWLEGIRVPEDVGVVAFGNSLISEITTPALTCVELKDYELGVKSAESMIAQIAGQDFDPVIVLEPQLIRRNST